MTKYNASIQVKLRQNLLDWFDSHQREMPWRSEKSLYRVWVSEIMLQQTQVVTVIPYFERFVERFPDVGSLAEADESTVLTFWEGLGYYRRARLLHQAAKTIVSDFEGEFPKSFGAVLGLPGIGRYTAGAILSIADNQTLPILEGNTIRVHARLAGVTGDVQKSGTQKSLWSLATSVVDPERPGDLNQALMELGSEVCTPKK
ncbi:MAG: A/G-specific adenine glycosylase, partial [Planctomycetota bacterium]|nr:A/G-specific adenine glycosylase [Planctomycetota bacterium]MEC8431339.1 A/G-specific adenine glycosylase [Planctomycetota bacterium]